MTPKTDEPKVANLVPRVDVTEQDDALTLYADLPGIDDSRLELTIANNTLTIEARAKPHNPAGMKLTRGEYELGTYRRVFAVSKEIDQDGITATLTNGLLTVTLPKRGASVRHITVNT